MILEDFMSEIEFRIKLLEETALSETFAVAITMGGFRFMPFRFAREHGFLIVEDIKSFFVSASSSTQNDLIVILFSTYRNGKGHLRFTVDEYENLFRPAAISGRIYTNINNVDIDETYLGFVRKNGEI